MSSRPTFPEDVVEPANIRSVPETDPLSIPTAPNGEAASDDASLPGPRTINVFDSGPKAAGGDQASVAGYDILKELGRGGMGTVYAARQRSLNRLVALKMIRSGVQAEARELGRFWSEAEAVARLQHPHIVQIHEVGEQNGWPYFSLELLQGGSLADKIAGAPQAARWSAQLVETLAQAMHYAHERGIIHRDLKPANVLLTADGTPKISDFGLAKLLDRDPPSGDCGAPRLPVRAPTEAGIVIGTPSYMAPEQAAGQNPSIGAATDVYALGAILYEMLTGRPPFRGEAPMETVLQVLNNEPVPPSRLRPKVPRDLETICLKCLEKKPQRRYASADALARDLRRFLDGAPIYARPIWMWERALKSAKRQPAKATLVAVLLLAGFVALVGGWLYSRQLSGHNEALKAALNDADDSARKRGRDLYVSRMNNAQRAWHEGRVGRVLELLDLYADPDPAQEDLRGFEWYYLRRLCHSEQRILRGHVSWVSSVALSRDGKYIASAAGDGAVMLWNAATGREVRTLRGHRGEVTSVAFSPNGLTLASAGTDGTVRLWSPGNGDALLVFRKHGGPVASVAFAPDGTTLASCGEGTSGPATVKIWNVTGRVIRDLPSSEQAISCVAFSPDGLHLATAHAKAGKSTTVKIWEVATGRVCLTLENAGRKIAFDPTGARLATAGPEQPVRVWDARTGQLVLTLQGLNGSATGVAFSPDGGRLACAAGDLGDVGEVKVWDLTAGREARTLRGHVGPVWAVAFSPDGRCLVSAGHDRTLKVWDLATDPELRQLSHHAGPVTGLACTRDGRLVSASQDGTVSVWDAKASRVPRTYRGHTGPVTAVAVSPDDEQLASAGRELKIWNVSDGTEVLTLSGYLGPIWSLTFSPDGQRLAAACLDGAVYVWNLRSASLAFVLRGHTGPATAVAFSPDGAQIATGAGGNGQLGEVKIWDASGGHELRSLIGHAHPVWFVAFNRDGGRLASASGTADRRHGEIKIWDTATGEEAGTFSGYTAPVWSIAFSPDGRRIASAGRTVKLWDVLTGQETFTLPGPADDYRMVIFAPDGQRIFAAGQSGTIKAWDAAGF